MLSNIDLLSFGCRTRSLKFPIILFTILFYGLSSPGFEAQADYDAVGPNGNSARANTRLASVRLAQGALAQPNFRIRSDDSAGLNADNGWAANLNTPAAIDAETVFRIRFEIEETTGGPFDNDFMLQWRKGAGVWIDAQQYDPPTATETEAVGIVVSGQYSDGDPTTDLLAGSSAGFTPGAGEEDNNTDNFSLSGEHTELEWTVIIHTFYDGAAQNINGDTFEFRVVHADGTPFQAPYNNPMITLNVPAGLIGGTYVENPNRIGPFIDANGNLYAVIEPSETFNRFMVVKSSDGGDSWAEVDGAHRPATVDLEGLDAVQVGDTLHIAHLPNTKVLYHRFRMSDHATGPDTWEFTDERITSSMDQTDQATALAVRSDGTIVAFYRRSDSEETIKYKIRSVEGTWGSENDLDADVGPDNTTWVTIAKGVSDKIHIFYQDHDAPVIYHRSLDSSDLLSAPEIVSTDIGTTNHEQMSIAPPIYWDNNGDERIMVGFKSGTDDKIYTSIITNDGTPSAPVLASDNAVNYGAGQSRAPAASLTVDGSTIYLHYSDQATGDIFRDINTNGAGWGTDVEEIDGVTAHWLRSNLLTHSADNGGNRVVGIIWDNGSDGYTGHIRYDEYQTNGQTPVNNTPIANDDSAGTPEATSVTIDVALNDTDADRNLDVTTANTNCGACTLPVNGSLVNNGNGSFTYTPNPAFIGSDSFVYAICDTESICDTATVVIAVGASVIEMLEVWVATGSDDAEERSTGTVDLDSSDLELVFDRDGSQTVGLRFNAITIPHGANITNAYVQFEVDEVNSVPTSLTIAGENADNAAVFLDSNSNISSRARTTSAVPWSPTPWASVGEAGLEQQTPDLAPIIQEIVSRPGWVSGNSLAIIVTGSGERTAVSFDGDPTGAALLHVAYQTGPVNATPVAVDDIACTPEGVAVSINVAANDSDAEGNLDPATANTNCATCAQPGNGSLINNGDGNFVYTPNPAFNGSDSFVYEICDTGARCDTATVAIVVLTASQSVFEVRIATNQDDAEESSAGVVSLNGHDLELVVDKGDNHTVGLRFTAVDVDQGAVITNAYVQFKVDETNSEPAFLTIQGENVEDASGFNSSDGDISSRPRTATSVPWSPRPWLTVGEVGLDQRTPNLAQVIQEIVNRPGWAGGNSLVIIVTGTGTRIAEAFNGDQDGAPLLHVEYGSGMAGTSTSTTYDNCGEAADDTSTTDGGDLPIYLPIATN